MGYTPTEWHAGDTITSAKLNKLENGVMDSGAISVLAVEGDTEDVIQMRAGDLFEACKTHTVYIKIEIPDEDNEQLLIISNARRYEDNYVFCAQHISIVNGSYGLEEETFIVCFHAESSNDYPVCEIIDPAVFRDSLVVEDIQDELQQPAKVIYNIFTHGTVRVKQTDGNGAENIYPLISASYSQNRGYIFNVQYGSFESSSGNSFPRKMSDTPIDITPV